jgi:hypothetical protein
MVYNWNNEGGYALQMNFSPGQTQMSEGNIVTRPYGTYSASSWHTDTSYIDALKNDADLALNYDMAAVFFNTSFSSSGINTYMPLVFDIAAAGTVNLAGYPVAVQDEVYSHAMWQSSGNALSNTDRILYYNADTSGGTSGSPVWQYFFETALRRVIAIHVAGGSWGNVGPRLVSQNQALIESWMEWTPHASSAGNSKSGCLIATAAYGSYLDPHVQILRGFRDGFLLHHKSGLLLVALYYQVSPPIAETIAVSKVLRLITRGCLMPVIGFAYMTVSFGMTITLLIITIFSLMMVSLIRLPGKRHKMTPNITMHDSPNT